MSVEGEARLDALCAALERNDPETTEIPYLNMQLQYGRRLGEALQGNHYVSSMNLNLSELLDVGEEGTDSVALLLQYMSESDVMRKVSLTNNVVSLPEVIETLVHLILLAIAENSCIEVLFLDTTIVPSDAIARLMRTTLSLKSLSVELSSSSSQELELLAEAFGANRSLESLRLDTGSNPAVVASILLRLDSLHCLRELSLWLSRDFVYRNEGMSKLNELAYFLHSTRSLEHLELWDYVFEKECMNSLVEGLQANQSLVELSILECSFTWEASVAFHSFMQMGETTSSIREMRFSGCFNMFDDSEGHCPFGDTLASMLIMPDKNQDTGLGIGPSLQVLDLSGGMLNVNEFLYTLAANADRIRLPCLRVDGSMDNDDWEFFIECLPKLVHLTELDIYTVNQDVDSRSFVDTLLRNGSLQHVVLALNRENFLNEAESRIVQSYCKRNEVIPILVGDKMDLSLLPTLFQSAKQAPRTAPNAILMGLLAVGNGIGPCCH